jgi:hypothetical protein
MSFVPIYIQLDEAAEWHNEQLNLHLTAEKPAAVFDYTNINADVIEALNANEIMQISQEDYFNVVGEDLEELDIIPHDLITLNQFMAPCPVAGFVMFGWYNNQWYKILWSTLESCLGGGGSFTPLHFTVGDTTPTAEPWHPTNGQSSFTNPDLVGYTAEQLLVSLNGVRLYPRSYYVNPLDETLFNWYEVDELTGELSVNVAFADGDIMEISKL